MSLGQVTYCLSKARYETQMIWEQPYETNLDRLRRYAAFACGSQGLGDGVLSEALEDVLDEVSSARSANLVLCSRFWTQPSERHRRAPSLCLKALADGRS